MVLDSLAYTGLSTADMFKVPADRQILRLGRINFGDNYRFLFGESAQGPAVLLRNPDSDIYSVFALGSESNLSNLIANEACTFYIGYGAKEDQEQHLVSLLANTVQKRSGCLDEMRRLMPKKRIPKVQQIPITVGNITIPDVLTSNEDDDHIVAILSETGLSSVLYNTKTRALQPKVYAWGSNGWKNPHKSFTENGKFFIDEREQRDGALWEISFTDKGYVAKQTGVQQ